MVGYELANNYNNISEFFDAGSTKTAILSNLPSGTSVAFRIRAKNEALPKTWGEWSEELVVVSCLCVVG